MWRRQQRRGSLGRTHNTQGNMARGEGSGRARWNDTLAPHDLRRTCARLCHQAGGELEQIQFLLGHVSVQTTERYLGCTQRIAAAVNDKIGIEPAS